MTKTHTIYDIFLYNGEETISNCRKAYLSQLEQEIIHIPIESTKTFQGALKTPKNGSLVIPHFELQGWDLEKHTRNYIKSLGYQGIFILGDVDEIPNLESIKYFLESDLEIAQFEMSYRCLFPNLETKEKWTKCKITRSLNYDLAEIRNQEFETLPHKGWHFTYMGGEREIIKKLKSFSHQEEFVQNYNFNSMMSVHNEPLTEATPYPIEFEVLNDYVEGIAASILCFNALSQDYTLKECIESVLWCDHVYILDAGSNDEITLDFLKNHQYKNVSVLYMPKDKFYEIEGKEKLSYFTNILLNHIEKARFKYVLNIQADEVLTTQSQQTILEALKQDKEAYFLKRINLWNTPYEYLDVEESRQPCSTNVIRIAKTKYRAIGDAESIDAFAETCIGELFHVGFVRDRHIMKNKVIHMQEKVFNIDHDPRLDKSEKFEPLHYFDKKDLKSIEIPNILEDWAKEKMKTITTKLQLPNVCLVCLDANKPNEAGLAIKMSIQDIDFGGILFFNNRDINGTNFGLPKDKIQCVDWECNSTQEYSKFMITSLYYYIAAYQESIKANFSHILIIQHDGYVLNADCWRNEFLNYDYIGAKWMYPENNVGNGGFSLRSVRLHKILQEDEFIKSNNFYHPEDEVISRTYKSYLANKYNIKIAPEQIADLFSYELHKPKQKTFGFHQFYQKPFKDIILIKRSAAMGDIIMIEPLIEYYIQQGNDVALDIPLDCWTFFENYHCMVDGKLSKVKLFTYQQVIGCPVGYIDLDNTYELNRRNLILQSYADWCGATPALRNSRLYNKNINFKPFRYALLHIEPHVFEGRSVYGIDFKEIAEYIKQKFGYLVFTVGSAFSQIPHIHTPTKDLLQQWVANADLFIGIESGIAHIAVGHRVKSIIMAGATNPKYIYPEINNLHILQKDCIFEGCYHNYIPNRDLKCINPNKLVCCTHETQDLINLIDKI